MTAIGIIFTWNKLKNFCASIQYMYSMMSLDI